LDSKHSKTVSVSAIMYSQVTHIDVSFTKYHTFLLPNITKRAYGILL